MARTGLKAQRTGGNAACGRRVQAGCQGGGDAEGWPSRTRRRPGVPHSEATPGWCESSSATGLPQNDRDCSQKNKNLFGVLRRLEIISLLDIFLNIQSQVYSACAVMCVSLFFEK